MSLEVGVGHKSPVVSTPLYPMFNYSDYSLWMDSQPDDLRFWLGIPTPTSPDPFRHLVILKNNLLADLYDLLIACREVGLMYAWDKPDLLLQSLDTLAVTPSLKPALNELIADYKTYCELLGQYRETQAVPDKSACVIDWWVVHDGWGEGQSEAQSEARLNELTARSKADWLKEPPSPELDAILAHFPTGMVCPKCGSSETKRKGKHRDKVRYRHQCKSCGHNFLK